MQQVKSAVPVSSLEVVSARYIMNNRTKTILILLNRLSHNIINYITCGKKEWKKGQNYEIF